MPTYTLIEYKLRRYFFLGNEYSIYIPPQIKQKVYRQENYDYLNGIKIIGSIVKKNKLEEINSIVPIILKVKKENILINDQHLILSLAICAKLTLNVNCVKMVQDAYDALSIICTSGLQLLMFVHFCKIVGQILHQQGFLQNKSSGFSQGFRKAICAWYLKKDPLTTTELIIRHKKYEGWTHKDIMKLVHIKSDNPCHQIYITHTLHGMQKVEEIFKPKLLAVKEENENEKFSREQLTFVYNYLNQINNLKKMDVEILQKDIGLNKWGEEFEVIPQKMINNLKIINSLVLQMPLKTLLDNTFRFAKKKLFLNTAPQEGLSNFILRFSNSVELEKEKIHPIESFIQFARYSRTGPYIIQLQNNIMKKQENENTNIPDDKLKIFIKSNKTTSEPLVEGSSNLMRQGEHGNQAGASSSKSGSNNNFKSNKNDKNSELPTLKMKVKNDDSNKKQNKLNENKVGTSKSLFQNKNLGCSKTLKISGDSSNTLDNQSKQLTEDLNIQVKSHNSQPTTTVLLKPLPKLSSSLVKFLSEELINKTLKVLKPTGRRILIAYDNRNYMKKKCCACTRLIKAHEAASMITLSLIGHEESQSNNHFIVGLEDAGKPYNQVEIDYSENLTHSYLESLMFKSSEVDENKEKNEIVNPLHPVSVIDWAKGKKMEYDVFVFLGTNNMHLKNIKKTIKDYNLYLKKPIKVIICCLNGKHSEQSNLGRSNTFLVVGFDKYVGTLIKSFINDEF